MWSDKAWAKIFLFGALMAGVASIATWSSRWEDEPRLISVKPVDKRKTMPGFAWASVNGLKWNLEEQRGKIVFVNFWATWCGPCRQETPDLVRVYAKYKGRGVAFAGVSLDDDPKDVVPSFVKRYKIEYPILIPSNESSLANAIETIPTSFLLDQKGRVARTWVGIVHEAELTRNIDELLAESGT